MTNDDCLEKLQKEELDILLTVGSFCREHNITWFLGSGTALGALRHHGFIPWDDDIDINMLREDYERFLELAATSLPQGYSLHTHENTPGFAGMFAKVYRDNTVFETKETKEAGCSQGIFIDIFPFDRIGDDDKTFKKQFTRALFWQRMLYLYYAKTIVVPDRGVLGAAEKFACRLAHYVVHAFGTPERMVAQFRKALVQTRDFSQKRARYSSFYWNRMCVFDADILVPVRFEEFEGYEMPIPGQCERYLEITYGDWQKLPDPEDRHTHLPQKLVFSDGTIWTAD